MAFTRKFLKEQGVPEEKIDTILAERNRSLGDYILKSEVDEQLKKAVDDAIKNQPVGDVKTSDEYKQLESKINMFTAFETDDFNDVKKPYREIIWDKLNHGEEHKPYSEQMGELKEKYPDMFTLQEIEDNKPQFGGNTKGTIPTGDKGESFSNYWGYSKK